MQNVLSARGFLSMNWFTKGEIFTSCLNFDLNQSASKKKNVFNKYVCVLQLSKNISLLVNDNEQGLSGGGVGA